MFNLVLSTLLLIKKDLGIAPLKAKTASLLPLLKRSMESLIGLSVSSIVLAFISRLRRMGPLALTGAPRSVDLLFFLLIRRLFLRFA